MFVQLYVLKRQGSNVPPTLQQEVLRIDLIQRMRPIDVSDWEEPCTELILDNEEPIQCQGELADILRALNGVFEQ